MSEIFWVTYGLLWIVVLVLGAVVIGLVRSFYDYRQQQSHPNHGDTPAPTFDFTDHLGKRFSSDDFKGVQHALLFVSPNCPNCTLAVNNLSSIARRVGDRITVVCVGTVAGCGELTVSMDEQVRTVVDERGELLQTFGVTTTPKAVIIDERGNLGPQGMILDPNDPEYIELIKSTSG